MEMTKEATVAFEAAKNGRIAAILLAIERAQAKSDFTLDRSQAAGLLKLAGHPKLP